VFHEKENHAGLILEVNYYFKLSFKAA